MNQDALPRLYLRRMMQHLVCRDVVQDDRDGFCGVQTCGHWNELALRQADILCVTAADRHGRNRLAKFETGDAFADLIHTADHVPTGRIGHLRCFRMDALARQYVRQAHARSQHFHPDLARLRMRALFFNQLESIGSAVAGDDDSRVSHEGTSDGPGLCTQQICMSVITLTPSQPAPRPSSNRLLLLIIFNGCSVELVQLNDACAIAHQTRHRQSSLCLVFRVNDGPSAGGKSTPHFSTAKVENSAWNSEQNFMYCSCDLNSPILSCWV